VGSIAAKASRGGGVGGITIPSVGISTPSTGCVAVVINGVVMGAKYALRASNRATST
jgi:hypothetical protein